LTASILNSRLNFRLFIAHLRLNETPNLGVHQTGSSSRGHVVNNHDCAEIVPDRAARLDSIVTMGSWVTFRIDWGFPRETRQLVYPEDYSPSEPKSP
jgi:regulator of nucleoside diphosphate kinase